MTVQAAADWLLECPDLHTAQQEWEDQLQWEERAQEADEQERQKVKKQLLAR